MLNNALKNSLLWDEVPGGTERMTQTYRLYRQGMSDNKVAVKANMSNANVKQGGRNQYTTTQFAHKMDFS